MAHHRFSVAFGLTLAGLMFVVASQRVYACSCPPIEPDAAYLNAALVFTGTAVKVDWASSEVLKDGKPKQDAEGRFVHQAFENLTYTLRAEQSGPDGRALDSDPLEVTAVKNAALVRLVVKAPK